MYADCRVITELVSIVLIFKLLGCVWCLCAS